MNIAILGNTGAGKTTFIQQMMKRFNKDYDNIIFNGKYQTIEDTYDPIMLEEFYHDPFNTGFKNQLEKLFKTIKDIALINYGRMAEHMLLDRSFLDVYVFTEAMNHLGMLGKAEWDENDYPILKKYLDSTFELFLNEIDLVVYLSSEYDILLKNITTRGRKQEVESIHKDELYGLGIQLNSEIEKLIEVLRNKKVKIIRLDSLSKHKLDSDEYIKALEIVNAVADLMETNTTVLPKNLT